MSSEGILEHMWKAFTHKVSYLPLPQPQLLSNDCPGQVCAGPKCCWKQKTAGLTEVPAPTSSAALQQLGSKGHRDHHCQPQTLAFLTHDVAVCCQLPLPPLQKATSYKSKIIALSCVSNHSSKRGWDMILNKTHYNSSLTELSHQGALLNTISNFSTVLFLLSAS